MTYTIDESRTALHYTANADVPAVFGGPRVIESITIHHWGALGQTHDGILDWFCAPTTSAQTSAHFVVSDGRINCIVSPPDAAWHAGNGEGNRTSIGIECHPEATDGDYATVAWLVSWLRGQYGDLPLYPHNHWTTTDCPGAWDVTRVDALARGVTPASTTVTPIGDPGMSFGPDDAVFTSKDGIKVSLNDYLKALDVKLSAVPSAVVNAEFPWHGFDGNVPAAGRKTTSIALDLGYADARAAGIIGAVKVDPKAVAAAVVASVSAVDAHEILTEMGKLLNPPAA